MKNKIKIPILLRIKLPNNSQMVLKIASKESKESLTKCIKHLNIIKRLLLYTYIIKRDSKVNSFHWPNFRSDYSRSTSNWNEVSILKNDLTFFILKYSNGQLISRFISFYFSIIVPKNSIYLAFYSIFWLLHQLFFIYSQKLRDWK